MTWTSNLDQFYIGSTFTKLCYIGKCNLTYLFRHISVMEIIDGEEITLAGEVGLLSHSVTIRGLNDAGWHEVIEACEEGFDTGE